MLDLGETIRRCGIALLLLLALSPFQKAQAVIGTLDTVPAATLLYPYFEVDLADSNGKSTLMGLHNTSATAMMTRVTLWSNTGVPIFNFNIYLTGYDAQTFDMRDVLNGTLPLTASAGQDPTNSISPKGPISQDINFASCNGQLPYGAVSPVFVSDLQSMLTGHASTAEFPGQCVGTNAGDNVARGYVTIDTVNQCSQSGIPSSLQQYFDAGIFMTGQNTLLGDFMLIDPSQHVLYSANATSIEADFTNAATTTPGNYTFYGRFVNWTAADRREPLATDWMAMGDTGDAGAIVWRDPKVNPAPFSCAVGRPSYAPLGQDGLTFFDRSGMVTTLPPAPTVVNPFPPPLTYADVATQKSGMDNASMQLPAQKMGWLGLGLNTFVTGSTGPAIDPTASQSLVILLSNHKNQPTYSSGVMAVPRDSAVQPLHFNTLPGVQ